MSNSVDPDETAHDEPSHLDRRCLQKPIIIAYGSERVKRDQDLNQVRKTPCFVNSQGGSSQEVIIYVCIIFRYPVLKQKH